MEEKKIKREQAASFWFLKGRSRELERGASEVKKGEEPKLFLWSFLFLGVREKKFEFLFFIWREWR